MRTLGKVLFTCGLVVLLASAVEAQEQKQRQFGRGFGQQTDPASLLLNETVQKEVKLEKDQLEKVQGLVEKMQAKNKELFTGLQGLSREEITAKFTEIRQKMSKEAYTALEGILKPDQVKRLKQIQTQQMGYEAFLDADVQKTLNLTADQKTKIKTIAEDISKEMGKMRTAAAGGNFQEMIEKMQTIRKEALTKIAGILDDNQKKAWKDVIGTPVELTFRRPGGN